jgi:MFS superfamily sulfate permease-like transporter
MLFVPRVSRLLASELVVGKGRVVRERQADDPPCDRLVLLGLEGQLFFGVAPELDAILADLTARVQRGARVIVLRLKRTHNPDAVCLERLHAFLKEMKRRGVVVLLCGVRRELIVLFERLGFGPFLPPDQVFEEAPAAGKEGTSLTSTQEAVKRAYELLGDDVCATCPRRQERGPDRDGEWYYQI